jgi:hypothetical protein
VLELETRATSSSQHRARLVIANLSSARSALLGSDSQEVENGRSVNIYCCHADKEMIYIMLLLILRSVHAQNFNLFMGILIFAVSQDKMYGIMFLSLYQCIYVPFLRLQFVVNKSCGLGQRPAVLSNVTNRAIL